ncbi:MAG: peptidoglycan DD-metalloendopeptidase family protein [candidate division Zixibacteria bacterium]|nr:peptidoglycan DD-metalloendopeptidase family protein [candidate division Zixibacteria bacterium]
MNVFRSNITRYAVFGALCAVLFYFLISRSGEYIEPVNSEIIEENISLNPNAVELSGTIQPRSSLYASMEISGAPRGLINRITGSLKEVFDLRSSKPGDEFVLKYCPPDTLLDFTYRTEGRNKYIVLPKENSLVAIKVRKELVKFIRCIGGRVDGSLWETLVRMGEDPELIAKLSDVFAWEIDFLTEVRNGDEFEFLVEGFEEDGEFVFYGDIMVARYSQKDLDHYAILFQNEHGNLSYYDLNGDSQRKTLLKSPLNYRRVASGFSHSRLHPILKIRRPHYGVDYAAATGTPVVAAGDGRIIFKGWQNQYGYTIIIRHNHGYQTYYGHLSRFAKGVKKNSWVEQNQVIGYVGSTGLSTGPHLDYRVKHNGRYINPLSMNPPSTDPIPEDLLADFFDVRDNILLTMNSYSADDKVYAYSESEKRQQLASVNQAGAAADLQP